MAQTSILVLGAGSWGTALAIQLGRNSHEVYLWDIDTRHIEKLIAQRCNARHLPSILFADNLSPVADLHDAADDIKDIVVAVPCHALRGTLERIKFIKTANICLACKGFEPGTQRLNHDVAGAVVSDAAISVLSGPSFAKEVAQGLPTAVVLAAESIDKAAHFSSIFHSARFRVYTHDDLIGVQVGGAVKNVMAIAAGIADGLGYGANARAALITRGLHEIQRLGIALGARSETFMGLSGLGDLVLTCTDDQSRNRRFGLALAKGKPQAQAKDEIGQAIEGIQTAAEVHHLALKHGMEMPITEQVVAVLEEKKSPAEAVQALLSRESTSETQPGLEK